MNSKQKFTKKSLKVIPSYSMLYGQNGSIEQLTRIVGRYSLFEWMSFLSRLQSHFWGTRSLDFEYVRSAAGGVLSAEVLKRLQEFEHKENLAGTLLLFYERQLTTLQQFCIIYAPAEKDSSLATENGRHDLSIALLVTKDLIDEGRPLKTTDDALACAIHDAIRTNTTPVSQYAARAHYFYNLDGSKSSKAIDEYFDLYEKATGVNARLAILGGLCEVIREFVKSSKDLANEWHAIPDPHVCENELERNCLIALKETRWGTPEQLRKFVIAIENNNDMRNWNLIGLSRYPIIHFPSGAFAINPTSLGRGLFDAIRHCILTSTLSGRLKELGIDKQGVGQIYGKIMEDYIYELLITCLGDRVRKIPETNNRKTCDFLIMFPDSLVLVEVKSEHFLAKEHFQYMTLNERFDEIEERVGFRKAVRQFDETIQAIRNSEIDVGDMNYDWTITPITPLIICEEKVPIVPLSWNNLIRPFDKELDHHRSAGPITPLRHLSIEEIEWLPDIKVPYDFGQIIRRWGANTDNHELPFRYFIESEFGSIDSTLLNERFKNAMIYLGDSLGLSTDELELE